MRILLGLLSHCSDGSVMRNGESITCNSFTIYDKLSFGSQYSSTFDRLLRECPVLSLTKCIEALIKPMNCQKMEKSIILQCARCNGLCSTQTESLNSIFIAVIEANQNNTTR